MTTFTIPEDILGIPLFVPTIYDFFDIENPGMPNGDACLVVRGDLNDGYKAFIPAPVFAEPHNFFHTSDLLTGRQWSMSCWLKLENLAVSSTEGLMLGCSTQYSTSNAWADNKNTTFPFALVVSGTNGFRVFREPLNNVASPNHFKVNNFVGSWQAFQKYWFLFVITQQTTGSFVQTVNAYMDTYPGAIAGDAEASGTAPSGSYQSPRYLHIGAYHAGGVGRGDLWRIGKWAFHDHVLTHAERIAIWQAMYGVSHSHTDDFSGVTLGSNWHGVTPFNFVSNQIQAPSGFATRSMSWVRCLGSPNHYSQIRAVQAGQRVCAAVRMGSYIPGTTDCYSAGWDAINVRWEIYRDTTLLTSIGTPTPSYPHTVRLEAETNGSDNVDLRLYHNGTLVLSVTDTDSSRRLLQSNAGVWLRGGNTAVSIADTFACGTL